MGLFRRKQSKDPRSHAAWTPHVDMDVARQVVWDLANSPGVGISDAQVRSIIARWNEVSDKPTDMLKMYDVMRSDKEAFDRPWKWLRKVMTVASANGDHELVCAGLFWTFHWEHALVPQLTQADLLDVGMNGGIPSAIKADIASIGGASATALPPDQMIVGDETGAFTAGMLANVAERLANG